MIARTPLDPAAGLPEIGAFPLNGAVPANVITIPTAPGACNNLNDAGMVTPWTVRNNSSAGNLVVTGLSHTALGLFDDPDADYVASSADNCATVYNPGQ